MSEPVRPTPPARSLGIHELRGLVSARHKALASTGPLDPALELIRTHYGADAASAEAFVAWLRGSVGEAPPAKGQAVERRHTAYDPRSGAPRAVETIPGSIPPRPA